MGICKFYANSGYCKYGNSCRFEHVDNRQSNKNVYSKTYNQPKQPQQQQQSHRGSNSRNDYVQHDDQQRSSGPVTFSFNKTAGQSLCPSQSSIEYLNLLVSSFTVQASSSTFSFNKTAQQALSGGQQKTFSFANNIAPQSANTAASGFSFNQMLSQVMQNKTPHSGFIQQNQPSLFGAQSNVTRPQQQHSFFGNTQQQQSHSSQTPSLFNVPAGSSIFGGNAKGSHPQANFTFAKEQPMGGSEGVVGSTAKGNQYTSMDKLTDYDKALFEQRDFTDFIPLVPPPVEFCF